MSPGLPGPWPWAHHSFSPQPQKGRYLLPTRKTSGQVYVVFKTFNIVKVAKMVTKINIKTGEREGREGKEGGRKGRGRMVLRLRRQIYIIHVALFGRRYHAVIETRWLRFPPHEINDNLVSSTFQDHLKSHGHELHLGIFL